MKTYVVGQVPSGYAPLPPENVLINGARYPADISGQYMISWAPNPREHMYGPAVSGDETYTLRLYDETDTLRRTVTGITGNSYTWSTEVADSGLGDLNWSDITALLHFDGADGSTTFTDQKGNAWSVNSGAPNISTARSKFGGASALFTDPADENVRASALNGVMTGDFTVEGWVYHGVSTSHINLFQIGNESSGRILFMTDLQTLKYNIFGSSTVTVGGTIPLSTWMHVAFSRSGSTL